MDSDVNGDEMSNLPVLQGKDVLVASTESKKRIPALAPEIRAQIGRKLMAVYEDVLHQPVPDRFLALLDELDQTDDADSPAVPL